jgi:hypothetical protein
LIAELREKCRGPRAIRKGAQRTQRLLGATGQPGYHVIGVDADTFQFGDELSNNLRVRHPAPVGAGDDVLRYNGSGQTGDVLERTADHVA